MKTRRCASILDSRASFTFWRSSELVFVLRIFVQINTFDHLHYFSFHLSHVLRQQHVSLNLHDRFFVFHMGELCGLWLLLQSINPALTSPGRRACVD